MAAYVENTPPLSVDTVTQGSVGARKTAGKLSANHQLPARAKDQGASTGADVELSALVDVVDYCKQDKWDAWDVVTSGGSANVQTLTTNANLAAYAAGMFRIVKAGFTNTGDLTLNENALGAKHVVRNDGAATVLVASEWIAGATYIVEYDGANWIKLTEMRGVASGVADLDTAALLPAARLHSVLAEPYSNLAMSSPAAGTLVTMTADSVDVGGYVFTNLNISLSTINSGANGVDTGGIAASTWYYIWAIANITNPTATAIALLISLSSSAPTMPANYTLKRRIGAFRTDGSAHVLEFAQQDRDVSINTQTALSGGTVTTLQTVGMSTVVPSTARRVRGYIVNNNAASYTQVCTNVTFGAVIVGQAAAASAPFELPLTVAQTIYYLVSAGGSATIIVSGWSFGP